MRIGLAFHGTGSGFRKPSHCSLNAPAAPPVPEARRWRRSSADLEITRSGEPFVEHFEGFRNDAPGFCEDLSGLPIDSPHALVFASNGRAMPENSDHPHPDLRIGEERFPVGDTEPHAEVEPVGKFLE